MRVAVTGLTLMLALTACDSRLTQAKSIVRSELGHPRYAEFRRLRPQGNKQVVCGEVDASDKPGSGWRYFIAYIDLKKAVIAPPGGVSAEGEMGNPLLAGAAEQFNHQCDRP